MTTHHPKNYLVVGPAWVGDMVMSQTLYRLLKQNEPNCIIDVIAPPWTHALLKRMPEINHAIEIPIKHGELKLIARWKIARQLAQTHYDHAIVLPNSFKSALIPFFAGINKRTGWKGEMRYGLLNDMRILDKTHYPLMIEQFMALGLPPNQTIPKKITPKLITNTSEAKAIAAKMNLSLDKPIIALCPGAEFGVSKRWLPVYFSEVANHFLKKGFNIWLFGSPNDIAIGKTIQYHTKVSCVNLIGKTQLEQAIDLLSLTQLVISNDSGLMHIAAALDKRLVSIYGSTSPTFTPPLTESLSLLQLNLSCSPCFKRECPLKHFRCMKDLKPPMVINAANQLLKNIIV